MFMDRVFNLLITLSLQISPLKKSTSRSSNLCQNVDKPLFLSCINKIYYHIREQSLYSERIKSNMNLFFRNALFSNSVSRAYIDVT